MSNRANRVRRLSGTAARTIRLGPARRLLKRYRFVLLQHSLHSQGNFMALDRTVASPKRRAAVSQVQSQAASINPNRLPATTRTASLTRCSTATATPRTDCHPLFDRMQLHAAGRSGAPPAGGRPVDGAAGHHVQRLRRPAGPASGSSRSTSCRGSSASEEWQMARARPEAADHRAQPVLQRRSTTSRRSSTTASCPSTWWRRPRVSASSASA